MTGVEVPGCQSLRVLQIATLQTPTGAYGGPLRVAVNQCQELIRQGHTATLAAGHKGYSSPPTHDGDLALRLFATRRLVPFAGFAGLTSPGLLRWLPGALGDFDVIHVHLARDLITLPAALIALRAGKPLAVQTHGMIDRSDHPLAAPLDLLATKRTLRRAGAVFYLTPGEKGDLLDVAGPLKNLEFLPNGVPESYITAPESDPSTEVLFLARLHSRKRPTLFAEVARDLIPVHPKVKFTLVGPDEGEASLVQELVRQVGDSAKLSWDGPSAPSAARARIASSSIYVLPSVDEPFPMSVLEAMSVGVPVIVTNSCGLAPSIKESRAGIVVDSSASQLRAAIDTLLQDPSLRQLMGQNAAELARRSFGMEQVTTKQLDVYRDLALSTT